MANNDPIKEYNTINLKKERIKEKFEMGGNVDEPITDLHDCSNDLSDSGSRKEEIEHAKFASKIKNNMFKSNTINEKDVWNNDTSNKSSKNGVKSIKTLIIVMFIIIIIPIIRIISIAGEAIYLIVDTIVDMGGLYLEENNYKTDLTNVNEENILPESFKKYLENVNVTLKVTEEKATYLQVHNLNDKSVSNLKIEIVFFDNDNNILKVDNVYIGTLIAWNVHYFEIFEAPSSYASFKYNIVAEDDSKYIDFNQKNIILNRETSYDEYYDRKISIKNNTNIDLDMVEVCVVYIKNDTIIEVDKYHLFDIETGKERSKEIHLNEYQDSYSIIMNINDVKIY